MMTKKELAQKYGEEKVFVVNKSDFNNLKNGINREDINNLIDRFLKEGYFVYRKDAEYNPKYFQLIPYVLIKHKNLYFATKRIGGDERLIDKISLGMGGHINPEDKNNGLENIFIENIKRELSKEELNIDMSKTISLDLEGFILYIDENDIVSQDHLGLFYVLNTEDESINVKETDKLDGKLMAREEILKHKDATESWSKILIEEYIE